LRRTALAVYLVLAVAVACPTFAFAANAGAGAELKAIDALNQVRTSNGLAPLRASGSLGQSANSYARWMLDHDFFGHQPRIPVASRFHTAGETLAWHSGFRPGPRRTVRQWMNSPSHRAVLLSSAFHMVGMGMERGRLGSRPVTMWVAHLGSR
jgi:uncharacterized protein YkwD